MLTPETVRGTILLIDRNDRLANERHLFEKAGLTVIAVSSAEEGWKLARERHPDMIVSEVMLEKPDAGFTLAYRLRKDAELASIPLLLLSSVFQATGTILDLSSPLERQWIQADAYLERPIAPEQLLARVISMLYRHTENN